MQPRTCTQCGADFTGRADAKYCSAACRKRAQRDRNRPSTADTVLKGKPSMNKWIVTCSPAEFNPSHPGFLTRWSFDKQWMAEKLAPGDVVFVLRTLPEARVAAVATVADRDPYPVTVMADDGWAPDSPKIGTIRWVRDLVGGRLLERPVPRDTLAADERFAGSRVLRMPGGWNPFQLTDTEWSALSEAIVLESLKSPATAVV
jgi:hypothetical protein